jgi:O-antigen ligase
MVAKLLEYSFLIYFISSSWSNKDIQWAGFICSIPVIGESLLAISQYLHQSSIGGILYLVGERSFTAETPGIANASVHGQLILRPYGTLPHPNVLAGYLLIMVILISFSSAKETSKYRKILEVSALLLGSICIILSFSRLVILLLCFITVMFLITNIVRKTKANGLQKQSNIGKYSLILLVILAGTFFIFRQLFLQLFYRFSQTSVREESFIQRKDLIQNAITIISKHPLFGVGLHNFLPALSQIRSPLSPTFYLQPVHNIFLLWIAETGLVGFIFLIIFLIKTIRQLLSLLSQRNPATKTLLLLFISLLILGSFDHYLLTLQQGQLLASLVLGMIWIKHKK